MVTLMAVAASSLAGQINSGTLVVYADLVYFFGKPLNCTMSKIDQELLAQLRNWSESQLR
jgi:hypothetical protein